MAQRFVKCIVHGNRGVGKTLLGHSFSNPSPPSYDIPDNISFMMVVDGQLYVMRLFDIGVAALEELDRLRPLYYHETDVFVLCFSVVDPPSFRNAAEKWMPELQHHCPGVPVLLVGTKVDLRSDPQVLCDLATRNQSPVTASQGERLAAEIGAVRYLECSAVTQVGVRGVCEAALRATAIPKPKKRQCVVM